MTERGTSRPDPTEEIALPVLHRDADLVAVHKPAGLLVHRTRLDAHETRFALQIVRRHLGQRVYPVHRLDKGTSGVVIFALSSTVARSLAAAFAERQVQKRYLAVVRGFPAESGEIDHPLQRSSLAYASDVERPSSVAQEAISRFRVLATTELPARVDRYPTARYALVEVTPVTGRYHQIRRHLKHISHHVIGDTTYGKGEHNRFFRQTLHCSRMLLACVELSLRHPVEQTPLRITAPLTDEFASVIRQLQWTDALAAAGIPLAAA